jgi:hypothetical protein
MINEQKLTKYMINCSYSDSNKKKLMLFTGGYRDFEIKIKNKEYYDWWEFDKYEYDVIFILTDDEDIENINKKIDFIKNIFGSKLKLVTSLFINEESREKYYQGFQNIKLDNDKIKNEAYKYYIDKLNDIKNIASVDDFLKLFENESFWDNFYHQFYKIYLSNQKVREIINPNDYNLFIRLRPDLILKKGNRPLEFKSSDELYEFINNRLITNNSDEFAIVCSDLCGFYSYNGFIKESETILNMFHGFKKHYPISVEDFSKSYTETLGVVHYFTFKQEWNFWNLLNDSFGNDFFRISGDYHTFYPR